MHRVTIAVDGMRCRRCVRQASALVRDVSGVHAVLADQGTGTITAIGTMTAQAVMSALRSTTFSTRLLDGP